MRYVSAHEAIRAIPDGSTVIFPHSCVEPVTLYGAFADELDRFRRLTVMSGLGFGDYRFLEKGVGVNFQYRTWQAAARIRHLFRDRRAGFVPMRYSEINRLIRRQGPIVPDVVVVQVSPPDADGMVSLGTSVSLSLDFVREARIVIAEVNEHMPATAGDSRVPAQRIDFAVRTDTPHGVYAPGRQSERDRRIVDRVLDLVPDRAWVQLGVGAVPDAVLFRLADKPGIQFHTGILTQGLMDFVDRARHDATIVTGELAGDAAFYDFCARTPRIRMAPARVTHHVPLLAGLPRFTSINSTIEVDLHGQCNGETIGEVQMSGVGGSLDYVEAAALAEEGVSIIALPSTTEDGRHSKIVARLAPGAVVTTPRFCTDYIVTEYGVARLKGLDLRQRAEALIAIAHPDFRDSLAAAT
ncbi:MAG: acetyl-CoA hydrolase/transferase family protein [Gammaproteobacteria bacterium]